MMAKGQFEMLDRGPGEAAERAGRRSWNRLIGASAMVGAFSGAAIVLSTHGDGGLFDRAIPLWAAILLTVLWLLVMGYSAWYYETRVDEVERNANYYGYAIGGGLVLTLYPVWYMAWWAGLTIEPMHEVLVGLLLVGGVAGYLWKKFG